MAQKDPRQKLHASLSIVSDALYIARRRLADATGVAELVDGAIHQQLLDMLYQLSQQQKAIDETLAELQNPTTGP